MRCAATTTCRLRTRLRDYYAQKDAARLWQRRRLIFFFRVAYTAPRDADAMPTPRFAFMSRMRERLFICHAASAYTFCCACSRDAQPCVDCYAMRLPSYTITPLRLAAAYFAAMRRLDATPFHAYFTLRHAAQRARDARDNVDACLCYLRVSLFHDFSDFS